MKRFLSILVAAMLLTSCSSAQEAPTRRSVVGFYFDTVVTLAAYVEDDVLLNEALGECAGYEKLLSKTVEGSDVWNINHAGGKPTQVSDHTINILKTALYVSELSDGAFDVTVAPAVALWDFTGANDVLPDEKAISEAVKRIDYRKVKIEGNTVTLPAETQIDLGGVAKGYIADRIAEFVVAKGLKDAILNFGGNVIALGKKPDGSSWSVGIQDPKQPTGQFLMAVHASDMTVVTSGIYERGFDLDGVRYHHLLDPKTGWPAQNELASTTIFTDQSALADALSTATFVLGASAGMALVESLPGVEAMFITRTGEVTATQGAWALVAK
ncbi:MAG: FAD:protein FMN transferase [Clostridia bacterium]